MVAIHDGLIELHTKNTSLVLSHKRDGLLENLHYGGRVTLAGGGPLFRKPDAGFGGDVLRGAGQPSLAALCLELSPQGRGDYRKTALLAQMPHGGLVSDFKFATATQADKAPGGGMPQGREPDEVVAVSFSEASGLSVEIFYSVFFEEDVITKKTRLTNRGAGPLRLLRALSNQLDLPGSGYALYNLTGAWARECDLVRRPLARGRLDFGCATGSSGAQCNPFFFLAEKNAGEEHGGVYGFNLVYSGNHQGSVEVDAMGKTRVLQGLHEEGFGWPLAPGESFITPEAVMTFSAEGLGGMSRNMHRFVKNQILPPRWRDAPRPVLFNNWEGTYFSFTEAKLLSMARVAAKLGAELFVLDDGWFGRRDSDKAGLGDYDVNRKKLPSGLSGLERKLRGMGLDFGLWVEPEMVSEDSALFEAHPDWAVQTPGYPPATGRNQLVLDLCREEVREYIITSMNKVLDSADIRYVKWDMNRCISDAWSPALRDQGGFNHRFTLGVYDLFDNICAARPDVLFEGCASGGNRYDLGVLYYMPQVWISDDTDAHQRQKIQTGASYGYPQCTMGCHVSAVPNHQTLRVTPLETRFNTAAFGVLGYELDPRHLTAPQKEDIKSQIAFYKQHRALLQYGDFYRLVNPFEAEGCRWMVVSPDKTRAIAGDFLDLLSPNTDGGPMRLAGLAPDAAYHMEVRRQKVNIETFGGLVNFLLPVHLNPDGLLVKTANKLYRLDTEQEEYTAYGDLLCKAGVMRKQDFSGAGYSENMRLLQDFASRLYVLEQLRE